MDSRPVKAPGVTAGQMLELAGVTYRQVDHWSRNGILWPVAGREGAGHPRRWPDEDVGVAHCIGVLTRLGIDLHVAARIARERDSAGSGARVRLSPHVEIVVQPGAWGESAGL